jgi:hypothetical protein
MDKLVEEKEAAVSVSPQDSQESSPFEVFKTILPFFVVF